MYKTTKKMTRILVLVLIITLVFSFLINIIKASHDIDNKAISLDTKITPSSPKVGDKITLKIDTKLPYTYSMRFLKINNSSNLQLISRDSEVMSENGFPISKSLNAYFKATKAGDAWIQYEIVFETGTVQPDGKIDNNSISGETFNFDDKLIIKALPELQPEPKKEEKPDLKPEPREIEPDLISNTKSEQEIKDELMKDIKYQIIIFVLAAILGLILIIGIIVLIFKKRKNKNVNNINKARENHSEETTQKFTDESKINPEE